MARLYADEQFPKIVIKLLLSHAGIIVCTEDLNRQRLANQIHEAINTTEDLTSQLIRINRPSK
ncbi:MAG: DUF5615 family PIN-like protein [Pseudanabaena sp.]